MSEAEFHTSLVLAILGASPAIAIALSLVAAPYGRHARAGWGREVRASAAWAFVESPGVWAFGLFYALGSRRLDPLPLLLAGLWLAHALHRCFVYPRALAGRGRGMSLSLVVMGFVCNLVHAYVNASALTRFGPPPGSPLGAAGVALGTLLFGLGYAVNRVADHRLQALRAGGYQVPRGFPFDRVSCPNYLGEIVQWFGFALAAGTAASLSLAVFSLSNLAPRARWHHRWYRERFADYPQERHALVPGVF